MLILLYGIDIDEPCDYISEEIKQECIYYKYTFCAKYCPWYYTSKS